MSTLEAHHPATPGRMTTMPGLNEARRAAATAAGYGPFDTPMSPLRSAYTDDHAGNVAFGLALSKWIRYNAYLHAAGDDAADPDILAVNADHVLMCATHAARYGDST